MKGRSRKRTLCYLGRERDGTDTVEKALAHWQTIERLRRFPTEEHAWVAKRAFLWLAKRHHPDSGGSHHGFLRVKDAYDRKRPVMAALS